MHIRRAHLEDFIQKLRLEASSSQPAVEPTSHIQHPFKHIVAGP
jgi:hypothetical protein